MIRLALAVGFLATFGVVTCVLVLILKDVFNKLKSPLDRADNQE